MQREEIINALVKYLSFEIDFDEISGIEENTGEIWITLNDGSVKSLSVIDCETENL